MDYSKRNREQISENLKRSQELSRKQLELTSKQRDNFNNDRERRRGAKDAGGNEVYQKPSILGYLIVALFVLFISAVIIGIIVMGLTSR
jgi:hypothetical protein